MAGDGKDMTNTDGSDFVQEVTPFPLAEDLLHVSRQLTSETVVLQLDLSDADKEKEIVGSINETLGPEHPFEPFLQESIISRTEVVEAPQGLATDGIDGNGSTLPAEHAAVSDLNPENAGTGDVSEKRVGEKIALFEGLAVVQGDDSEEFGLRKIESLDSQYDSQNDPGTMPGAELSEAPLSHNELAENGEVDGLTDRAAQRIGENAVSSGEDILFEGLTLVDLSSEAPANGAVNFELGGVSVMERSAEVTRESVRIDGKNESVTASESLNVTSKEIEVSSGPHTDVTNETRKVETLGEILSRDREEKASREVGKETGEEINSGQSSSGNHVRIASDPMGSTSVGSQGNGDTMPRKVLKSAPLVNSDGNDAVNHRSSTSGTNIVGDILYNIAVGDEEGRSRQRILAFAAKRYAANVERNPEDHDALYNWALVLQESADNAGPEVGSPGKDALLEEACKKYEAATQLCPTLHEAYYNWAIAISDRAKIRGRTKEAEDLWKQACDRYDRAVQLNWNSPQALNNWGLALQELGAIVALKEKRAIVKKAIRKFRAAIRLRFDFHRAVYNLGTVLYGLGEDIAWSGRKLSSKELSPADLNSLSAIYITAAHALKPDYPCRCIEVPCG
ncbi:uncharacterized protein [Physcomitrium patens]|uniref:uncharacterized protein isoform X2 n=1 Tax=Physcomitrium patens TaxID=3218 RepID=UPI003CCDA742